MIRILVSSIAYLEARLPGIKGGRIEPLQHFLVGNGVG